MIRSPRGKVGRSCPANQPAPLRPSYPEPVAARAAEPTPAKIEQPVEPVAEAAPAAEPFTPASPTEPKLVMETQPESLSTPPAELTALKSPKGYVVLTIGLRARERQPGTSAGGSRRYRVICCGRFCSTTLPSSGIRDWCFRRCGACCGRG